MPPERPRVPHPEALYPLAEVRRAIESLPHCRRIGLQVAELARGRCTLRLEYDPELVGDPDRGVVHGGVITTIMDTAGGLVAFSVVERGRTVATLDLRIDYLGPAAPGRAISGRAECYRLTRSVAFVRGIAYHDDPDDPIAHAAATYMVGSVGFAVPGPGDTA